MLREKTIECAKSAVKSSIYEGLIEDIKNQIQENINLLILIINIIITFKLFIYFNKIIFTSYTIKKNY